MQWLIYTWRLKVKQNTRQMANCERHRCPACEFGKGHLQVDKNRTENNNPMKEKYLKTDHNIPGHMVSSDNYIYQDPARIYCSKGK